MGVLTILNRTERRWDERQKVNEGQCTEIYTIAIEINLEEQTMKCRHASDRYKMCVIVAESSAGYAK